MKRLESTAVCLRLWLLALMAVLGVTGGAVSVTQPETAPGIIKNFGRVNDNYYRCAQPNAQGFVHLKSLGIKTVIDLRKDSESEASEWARASGLQYFNIPLKASRAATEEQTSYFLKLVNDRNNWPVYVHCKGGRHRTGALTAIYRITNDGWTADQAFDEMKRYDFNHGFFGGPSAQKKFVYSYYLRMRQAPFGVR